MLNNVYSRISVLSTLFLNLKRSSKQSGLLEFRDNIMFSDMDRFYSVLKFRSVLSISASMCIKSINIKI